MSAMIALSREGAREIIESIQDDNGALAEEDLEGLSEVRKARIKKRMGRLREQLSAALGALTKDLYSKNTRFIYELIQNADDNQYTIAGESKSFLTLTIEDKRLIIDSNENGFTEQNVRAICSTGESTKTKIAGFIGEKGIGFKSVFKVAKKVRIQSGPFCFSFKYDGEDAFGMVTPWEEMHENLPEGVCTRTILTFHDSEKAAESSKEICALSGTLLLFLSRLRCLEVVENFQDQPPSRTKYTVERPANSKFEKIHELKNEKLKSFKFYVFRHIVPKMPQEAARTGITQSEVVLAFPVDEKDSPLISEQQLYAFLPIRPIGFGFLIQSDFIMQASREDLKDSKWNRKLRSATAKAFVNAVCELCGSSSTLKYCWMRYLSINKVVDPFWIELRTKIEDKLSTAAVIRSRPPHTWNTISQSRLLTNSTDYNGDPLFDDFDGQPFKWRYVNAKYKAEDLEILQKLGIRAENDTEFLSRVKADLGKRFSRIRENMEQDWHTKVAIRLCTIAAKPELVTRLNLIPLYHKGLFPDHWVSSKDVPIYFHKIEGVSIPKDLGLKIIWPSAEANADRKVLFGLLGVKICDKGTVMSKIQIKYREHDVKPSIDCSASHLRFLFWFSGSAGSKWARNWTIDNRENRRCQRQQGVDQDLYFANAELEHGAERLFAKQDNNPNSGHKVDIIHDTYLSAVPDDVQRNGKSWRQWLSEEVQVLDFPVIYKKGLKTFPKDFGYVVRHRSDQLLNVIRAQKDKLKSCPREITLQLMTAEVPSEAGMYSLWETCLPLPSLKRTIQEFHVSTFPFLKMTKELAESDLDAWCFTKDLGVVTAEGFEFYLLIMKNIVKGLSVFVAEERMCQSLLKCYESLKRSCIRSEEKTELDDFFTTTKSIWCYDKHQEKEVLCSSQEVVWNGPHWLTIKPCLSDKPEYAKPEMKHFFCFLLDIGNATIYDFFDELKTMRRSNVKNTAKTKEIYQSIQQAIDISPCEDLRKIFAEESLVLDPHKKVWVPPSACIWAASKTQIPGKYSIASGYESLKDFFVTKLEVLPPDLSMYVEALKSFAFADRSVPIETKIANIREQIKVISAMKPTTKALKSLLQLEILPVLTPNGGQRLVSCEDDFVIVDKVEYGNLFKNQIYTFDFSVKELISLSSFVLALGLEQKYISTLVTEVTSAANAMQNPQQTRWFQKKAYALFSCVSHYDSPKVRDGFTLDHFECASLYTGDKITKSVKLTLNQRTYSAQEKHSNFHLDESQANLKLYVPQDEDRRELCYLEDLPQRLLRFFEVSNHNAEALFSKLIQCQSQVTLNRLLISHGVHVISSRLHLQSPDLDNSHVSDNVSTPPGSGDETVIGETEFPLRSPPPQRLYSTNPVASATVGDHAPTVGVSSSQQWTQSFNSLNANFDFRFEPPASSQDVSVDHYARLLQRIIEAAAETEFPEYGQSSLSTLSQTGLPIFGYRDQERDFKVGAAGELFVFELLTNLSLPGFSVTNWESSIRGRVTVHEKYRDLPKQTRRETADILYKDNDGVFTKLLIDKGYLKQAVWQSASPQYLLEVKTTTGRLQDPFFISPSQYNRMRNMTLSLNQASSPVYVVFRVFNIESRVGLRVYVDPASQSKPELEFSADPWIVTPV